MRPVSPTSYDRFFDELEDLNSTSSTSKVTPIFHDSAHEILPSVPLEQRAISPHLSEDPLASASRVNIAAKRKFEHKSEEEKPYKENPKCLIPNEKSSTPRLDPDVTQRLLNAFNAFHGSKGPNTFSILERKYELCQGWMRAHYKALFDTLTKEEERGKLFEDQDQILNSTAVFVIEERIKQLLPLARANSHLYTKDIADQILLTVSEKMDLVFIQTFNKMHTLPLSEFVKIKRLAIHFKLKGMNPYYKTLQTILQKEQTSKMSDEDISAACRTHVVLNRIHLLLPLARAHPEFYLKAVFPVLPEVVSMATPVFLFPEFK